VFIDTTDRTIQTVMNTEQFTRISSPTVNRQFCTHTTSTLGLYPWWWSQHSTSQIRFSTSTAQCSSDEHSWSTFTLLSILAHHYASCALACEQKNECPRAEHWSHMPLMSFLIIQVCRSYSFGSNWHS